ncbi:MAG: dinitrogenase iron-molybdenum cofactor biosynthesis protein [Alphaproteobacteria bacterium]|nr:dinitrogenase iron-molybdenum cofactor biosynthesis protein [Alphaproteobacteria bacterium]
MKKIIAVPSNNPGGMDAGISAHFGHCDAYTLVEFENNEIKKTSILPNKPHEDGGCMAVVNFIAENGIQELLVNGMGMRPLIGLNHAGIKVYQSGNIQTVKEAVEAHIDEKLPMFGQEQTCGGGIVH